MIRAENGKHFQSFKCIFNLKFLLLFQSKVEREGASL